MSGTKPPFRFWSFFFSLRGRLAPWPFAGIFLLTGVVVVALAQAADAILSHTQAMNVETAANVFTFLPLSCAACRRLHDAGMTGLPAILYIAAITGMGIPEAWLPPQAHEAMGWSFLFITIVLFVLPGSKGTNRYGPDPRNPDTAPDVF